MRQMLWWVAWYPFYSEETEVQGGAVTKEGHDTWGSLKPHIRVLWSFGLNPFPNTQRETKGFSLRPSGAARPAVCVLHLEPALQLKFCSTYLIPSPDPEAGGPNSVLPGAFRKTLGRGVAGLRTDTPLSQDQLPSLAEESTS